MLLTILAFVVSLSCALAATRRLKSAVEVTSLDPASIVRALRAQSSDEQPRLWAGVRKELETPGAAAWERDLAAALDVSSAERTALVNEQLAELDYRAQRWARVPRVCASISTSFGFLLAFSKVASLAADMGAIDFGAAVGVAINVVALGIAGGAVCLAAHVHASSIVRRRLAATDVLVACLEGLPTAESARDGG